MIPGHWRLKQEGHKFKSSLAYIARPPPHKPKYSTVKQKQVRDLEGLLLFS